jgi:hypothetical protein
MNKISKKINNKYLKTITSGLNNLINEFIKFFHQLFANLHSASTSDMCNHYIFARPLGGNLF